MEDYELTLFDRLNMIRDTINKYGEEKFYLSFSGGKRRDGDFKGAKKK